MIDLRLPGWQVTTLTVEMVTGSHCEDQTDRSLHQQSCPSLCPSTQRSHLSPSKMASALHPLPLRAPPWQNPPPTVKQSYGDRA